MEECNEIGEGISDMSGGKTRREIGCENACRKKRGRMKHDEDERVKKLKRRREEEDAKEL